MVIADIAAEVLEAINVGQLGTVYKELSRVGSHVGVVVINRASPLYDPGSNPGLRMLAEICRFQSDFEGFSPGTTVLGGRGWRSW